MYSRFGKRCFDFVCSLAGLIALSPLMIVAALAVKLTSKGPALFSQMRTGQWGRPFRIYKLRSMRVSKAVSAPLVTAAGDPRITPVGRWLRKTRVDELPQLFNVLVGDMSLVGPRPEVPRYTAKYNERQKQIFIAKPGITGLSIIMDEEELMADQPDTEEFYLKTIMPAKLEIDIAYTENIRFSEDLRCLWFTVAGLLVRTAGAKFLSKEAMER